MLWTNEDEATKTQHDRLGCQVQKCTPIQKYKRFEFGCCCHCLSPAFHLVPSPLLWLFHSHCRPFLLRPMSAWPVSYLAFLACSVVPGLPMRLMLWPAVKFTMRILWQKWESRVELPKGTFYLFKHIHIKFKNTVNTLDARAHFRLCSLSLSHVRKLTTQRKFRREHKRQQQQRWVLPFSFFGNSILESFEW